MPSLRSHTTTAGRRMAGARSLWRANGMEEQHFGRPIIAVVNSFSQFVPGHVHLHEVGQFVKAVIREQGCFAAEFNTIALDDGISMGHEGMLYSLPSRELIADSVEYVVNAHQADAIICISNCDKITPAMLMAAMRLNIPAIFVSGGAMEAGKTGDRALDLVDAMVAAADPDIGDEELLVLEREACPTCGSCSGMFTANSMNCLAEALGLALPGNGTLVATHRNRRKLFEQASRRIVEMALAFYRDNDASVLPRSIATRASFENAMALDVAMGGSTNTVLHLLAIAHEAGVEFTMADIDRISLRTPCLCKVAPNSKIHMEDVHRAGGVFRILGELSRGGLLDLFPSRCDGLSMGEAIRRFDIRSPEAGNDVQEFFLSAPGGGRSLRMASQSNFYPEPDTDPQKGAVRDVDHAFSSDGGLAILFGNLAVDGCVVKTAGVDESILRFSGPARVFESQEDAVNGILGGKIAAGDVVLIRYEGPAGGPGMQEMLYPTSYLKAMGLAQSCALVTDGRFSGGSSGLSIGHVSPEAAAGGTIALVRDGDLIGLDIPSRAIRLDVSEEELDRRRRAEEARGAAAFTPADRHRVIPTTLQLYSRHISSADRGAVRLL